MIRDYVSTDSERRADLWFHFEAGASIEERDKLLSERVDGSGLDIAVFSQNSEWRRENGWISHCYGKKEAAPIYVSTTPVKANTEIVSFLLPQTVSAAQSQVREVEVIGGRLLKSHISTRYSYGTQRSVGKG